MLKYIYFPKMNVNTNDSNSAGNSPVIEVLSHNYIRYNKEIDDRIVNKPECFCISTANGNYGGLKYGRIGDSIKSLKWQKGYNILICDCALFTTEAQLDCESSDNCTIHVNVNYLVKIDDTDPESLPYIAFGLISDTGRKGDNGCSKVYLQDVKNLVKNQLGNLVSGYVRYNTSDYLRKKKAAKELTTELEQGFYRSGLHIEGVSVTVKPISEPKKEAIPLSICVSEDLMVVKDECYFSR